MEAFVIRKALLAASFAAIVLVSLAPTNGEADPCPSYRDCGPTSEPMDTGQ